MAEEYLHILEAFVRAWCIPFYLRSISENAPIILGVLTRHYEQDAERVKDKPIRFAFFVTFAF